MGWDEYVASNLESVSRLDEAIFGLAHLFADLTAVDGAVVFTGGFELLGFGAEISGGLERVKTVARALDVEGIETEQVNAENFGTRHRSVYRLCSAVHEAMGIVISQDRSVRLVKKKSVIKNLPGAVLRVGGQLIMHKSYNSRVSGSGGRL